MIRRALILVLFALSASAQERWWFFFEEAETAELIQKLAKENKAADRGDRRRQSDLDGRHSTGRGAPDRGRRERPDRAHRTRGRDSRAARRAAHRRPRALSHPRPHRRARAHAGVEQRLPPATDARSDDGARDVRLPVAAARPRRRARQPAARADAVRGQPHPERRTDGHLRDRRHYARGGGAGRARTEAGRTSRRTTPSRATSTRPSSTRRKRSTSASSATSPCARRSPRPSPADTSRSSTSRATTWTTT